MDRGDKGKTCVLFWMYVGDYGCVLGGSDVGLESQHVSIKIRYFGKDPCDVANDEIAFTQAQVLPWPLVS